MSNGKTETVETAPVPVQLQNSSINIAGVPVMERETSIETLFTSYLAVVAREDQKVREEVEVAQTPHEGTCSLLGPHTGRYLIGIYDRPLSFHGCGIGWFFFVFGFTFPPLWYYATFLYFKNQSFKDPRERAGLAASAIAALICSVVVLVALFVVLS